MNLFHKPSVALMTTADTTTPTTTTSTAASLMPLVVYYLPRRKKLVMELVSEMDTPQKAPLMRELVKGSTLTIETLNNTNKKFVHIPQCLNQLSAMLQNMKYKFILEIVTTFQAGAKKVADSLNRGAVWLCRGLADLYRAECVQAASCAVITCISRMSVEATGAMWTDAKRTKSKSRKISQHLLDWFKKPITAKEPDVDAFATRPQVKWKYYYSRLAWWREKLVRC